MLDCDLVVMPVHLAMHWTCAVVSLRDPEFLYLDSMGVRRWQHTCRACVLSASRGRSAPWCAFDCCLRLNVTSAIVCMSLLTHGVI